MKSPERILELIKFALVTGMGIIFLCYSEEAASSVRDSLLFTASTIIPTLFPFMVISKLIASSELTERFGKKAEFFTRKPFGLSRDTSMAVLLGFISGFPVGALTVCDRYKEGKLTNKEAVRAVALAHNTGPAFPVGLVGAVLWQRKSFGIFLYLSQIFSWMLIACVYRDNISAENASSNAVNGKRKTSFLTQITDSVTTSAVACVNIAGFTVFMRLCSEIVVSSLTNLPFFAVALVSSLFEFSDGCCKAAKLEGMVGCALTGFAIGFGGLSALFQSASVALKCGLSVRPLIIIKLLHGAICSCLAALYSVIFPFTSDRVTVTNIFTRSVNKTDMLCLAVIIVMYSILKKTIKPAKRQ